MSRIRVNHYKFESTAAIIDEYIQKQESYMNIINSNIEEAGHYWSGKDYMEFCKQWNEINSTASTSEQIKKSLKNYAEVLRKTGNMYKEAQARAVNRANSLPQW